jgi:death-on-curing protein
VRKYNYFTTEFAVVVHDMIIDISGGYGGIKELGLIESVVGFVQNNNYYPKFHFKLSHLVFSVAMNHAFNDANKRSAVALGAYFLQINGYENLVGKFIIEMENIVVWVVEKKVSKVMLTKIMKSLLKTGEISEKLKIEILENIKIK